MADLLARFKLVDEMSDRLGNIADRGQGMLEQWERAGEAANAAFGGMSGAVTSVTASADGVASSIDSIQAAANNASASADTLSDSLGEYENAVNSAAEQTNRWTDAVGNYDQSALEAIYTIEELVEMGLMSADALEEQGRMLELCEQSANSLSTAMNATADIQNDLTTAIEKADTAISELADNENVSAETKAELANAAERAQEAMRELSRAQEEADAAMEAYNQTMASGTTDLSQLEAAAERAAHAAEELAEANGAASEATEELSRATEEATEEAENSEQSGVGAIEGIAGALAAAGITAKVYEIAEAVYELAESFTEAEKIIIATTGATGRELDMFMESATRVFSSSHADNLTDVAAGMSEVKRATGLAGEELENATSASIALEDVLGYGVSESARTASALMKNFGVTSEEAYNLITIGAQSGADKNGDLLDVLNEYSAHYAALGLSAEEFLSSLIDGAEAGVFSVDKVGDAVKEFNIRAKDGSESSAEAFEMLGMDADVMAARFAAGGETASTAFFDVVAALDSLDDPMQKNTAAVALFGTMYEDLEAGILPVLSNVEGGTIKMQNALGKVTDEAKSLGDEWKEAGNSISTAFTAAIEPTVTGISSAMASVAKGFGEFLNQHPEVAKAITALGVGFGVMVVAIAAVSVASLTAIPAVAALGTAISAAIWPITLIAIAVAAVVAAVLFLADAFSAAEDETAGMTATTRAQYYELQELNAEYEEACEKYGETSEEASRLKYQVDDLSAAFEANRQTVEEFTAEVDALCESVSQVTSDFNDSMTAIKNTEVGSLALIQKYEDLASQADLTGAQEKELEAITKRLSETYPDLAAQMDGATLSTEDYVEAMKKACEQQAEEQRQAQAQETYVEALQKRAELTEEIAKAQENVNLEQARMDDMSGWTHFWTAGEWDDLEAYQAALEELNAAQAENEATIAQIEQGWEDISAAEQAAAEETVSWEDAAATAYENVKDRVIELCEAYGEAYNAALESFEGQFGLFDEASMKSEEYVNSTVENAQKALDSQLAYWDSYLANIEVLKSTSAEQLGITQENYEALMAYAQNGSEEAAGLAASMAEAINNGDAEAVAALANTVGEVNAKQQEIAATTADWVTNFSSQMDEIEQEMQSTVEGMNLDTEAAASATATINAYANSIRAGKANAVAAAEEVANAVSAAFASAKTSVNVSVNSSGVPGHANGTTNAESLFLAGERGPELVARPAAAYANGTTDSTDYFIAGENGPELIAGEPGSTVFPTQETDRLISALNEKRRPLQVFADTGAKAGAEGGGATEQVKRILLEIAGSGAIEVGGGGTDKETILEVLYEHLKPVLMNIIQGEIYEEGEYSYEY